MIWKSLLWGIFLLATAALGKAPPTVDSVRVVEEGEKKLLQTRILSYEKAGVKLDLVGVVHLGEKEYYQTLNEKLAGYDAVLYEMIGEGKPSKPHESPPEIRDDQGKGEMEVVSKMYSLYTSLLELELQMNRIDYTADHFIHADMTAQEFQDALAEKGETVMKFAAQNFSMAALEEVDQAAMLGAMITGDSTALKDSFISLLGSADETVNQKQDTSVIIRVRNEKCLRVLEKALSEEAQPPARVAIFYGAAHLPDFHHQLSAKGWHKTGGEWVDAWTVNLSK